MEEEVKKADFTIEMMLENGWTKIEHYDVYLFEKQIENRNPINGSEDSDIKLVVHSMYNVWRFAILLPDGGLLNFVANNMAELNDFENRIDFYDPPF